ncbi:uncharacterized protein LOC117641031 [Thrips palmi]|uniref:Uncharacterized protein LOC117641031 n=1 Tax=Thrips palmi TaxID=161013 RepID=A0A6P8YCG0_THRPL|nr:uncharacterized protein LOC117641031 [Thrips palmi]
MRTATSLVLLGMLWAVTVNAAAAKRGERDSEDFFFRQLRSPFERKLKGTRRGCSAYGHSCFGGYGKRGGGALVAPLPLAMPRDQRGQAEGQADRDADAGMQAGMQAEAEDKATVPAVELDGARGVPLGLGVPLGAPGLHAGDANDATLIILRQTPVSSRAPLWGRSLAPPARMLRGDGGDLDRADSDEEADPYNAVANRLFLRRWLRTYRRPAERSPH